MTGLKREAIVVKLCLQGVIKTLSVSKNILEGTIYYHTGEDVKVHEGFRKEIKVCTPASHSFITCASS